MDTRVMEHVLAGLSCFITGEAGTGKTHLLSALVTQLNKKQKRVHVTASTGAAASAIGGMTLHCYMGMRLGLLKIEDIMFYQTKQCISRITRTQVLIIDEISMLSSDTFDTVDLIMRVLRKSNRPFGGVQLVMCGDFCQLPPVKAEFCFLSETWKFFTIPTFVLDTVRRTQDDRLVKLLREIKCLRQGQCLSDSVISTLNYLSRAVVYEDSAIRPTSLCATNNECSLINDSELNKLGGSPITFTSTDVGPSQHLETVQQIVKLSVGAQVILIVNINVAHGLTNGTQGVITRFDSNSNKSLGYPYVKFLINGNMVERLVRPYAFTIMDGDVVISSRKQIPLILAWAITIHKSQGMTLRRLELRLSSVFEPGMAYVALSRGVTLDTIQVVDYSPKKIYAHSDVIEYMQQLESGETD